MVTNTEIIALFEKIAETHTAIGHQPAASPAVNRFWRFDPNELISGTANALDFGALLLGLSSQQKGNLNWDYNDVGTGTYKGKYISLHIIAKFKEGGFDDEETKAQACENCAEDIILWLKNVANGSNQDEWPTVQLMNVNRVPVRRVNNIGVANCTGIIATIELREPMQYNTGNPLNAMTP